LGFFNKYLGILTNSPIFCMGELFWKNLKFVKKNKEFITDDLKLNRGMNIKLKTINIEEPSVIEIDMAFFAKPLYELEVDEYNQAIGRIKHSFNKICGQFVKTNKDILSGKYINDFKFTSANLKKGYNKYVVLLLYVKQRDTMAFNKIKKMLKPNLKEMSGQLIESIKKEGFSCHKNKE
jgi:hypothetical protein